MQDNNKEETIRYAIYFVTNSSTVRGVAKHFGVSKSHVHKKLSNMSEEMFVFEVNKRLAAQVKQLLEKNKQERHIRGGNATKQKYLKDKLQKN